MRISIEKCTPCGTVAAPPSKSMAHRLLICGGLSRGRSVIRGIAPSQDVLATLDCLKALGAAFTYEDDTVTIDGIGIPGPAAGPLLCRESGSTLRFFLPLCMFGNDGKLLYGSETLLGRPLGVYRDICKEQGIRFENDGKQISVKGNLSAGIYSVPGNISSQFITGLLFALPLLDGDSQINIVPPIESLSYINMTLDALRTFGVSVYWEDSCTLKIKGNQQFRPQQVAVEGDYSNAAFFAALGCLGADVRVTGLKEDSLQGDKVYNELFQKLGGTAPQIDISDCPDLGPVLFAVAAAKNGGVFTGTRRLRIKESDRGAAMAEELQKFGVSVDIEEDRITVEPGAFYKPQEVLYGHNDHRIVMSLCVLLTLVGGSIDGAEAVNKSMPDFFDRMKSLGVTVKDAPFDKSI